MKKIMGTVIVGLCGVSFDAACMYKTLGEQEKGTGVEEKSSRPHRRTTADRVADIKAACSPQEYREFQEAMQRDFEDQQAEEEKEKAFQRAVQEASNRLRAQIQNQGSPRVKAH